MGGRRAEVPGRGRPPQEQAGEVTGVGWISADIAEHPFLTPAQTLLVATLRTRSVYLERGKLLIQRHMENTGK